MGWQRQGKGKEPSLGGVVCVPWGSGTTGEAPRWWLTEGGCVSACACRGRGRLCVGASPCHNGSAIIQPKHSQTAKKLQNRSTSMR